MFKVVAIGVTALFVTASPAAYAQTAANAATPSASDLSGLTDLRIDVVKAALKLTPDQEKYWPSIEDAIRTRQILAPRTCRTLRARPHAKSPREIARLLHRPA